MLGIPGKVLVKVGDLVKWNIGASEEEVDYWLWDSYALLPAAANYSGIIIAIGIFADNNDVKVLWSDGSIMAARIKDIEVINEA